MCIRDRPRGGSRISGWGGDDGGAEGPEQGAVGAKRRSAEGWGLGRGAVAPPRYGGIATRKFLKFNLQICVFLCIFAPVSDAEFNATCSNFRSLGGVRRSSLGEGRKGGTGRAEPKGGTFRFRP